MTLRLTCSIIIVLLISTVSFSQKIVWRQKQSFPVETRIGSTVTFNDKIYYLGGTPVLNQAYEYDPESDSWAAKASMPFDIRTPYSLVKVQDSLYATSLDENISLHQRYDPVNETWRALAPQSPVRYHTRGAVVDGKIYIIGGTNSDNTEVYSNNQMYDPVLGTWEEKAPIPVAKHAYGIAVVEDKIYVIGGSTQGASDVWSPTSSVHVYDPATDTWEETTPMESSRGNAAVVTIDNKIIVVGGWENNQYVTSRSDIFDPATKQWTRTNSLVRVANMGYAEINGNFYIIGGTAAKVIGGDFYWEDFNTVYQGELITNGNFIPEVDHALPDTSALTGERLSFNIPDFSFIDDDTLIFTAKLIDGTDLPSWLKLNPYSNKFSGIPDKEGILEVIVTATDNYNASVTDTFQIVVSNPAAINNKETGRIQIFPNPTSQSIQIKAESLSLKSSNFKIIDLSGKIVKQGLLNSKTIDISGLPKGIYMLRLKTSEGIITEKLVIE